MPVTRLELTPLEMRPLQINCVSTKRGRKMLRRSLRGVLGARVDGVLVAAGIDPSLRAEALGIEEWAALTREAGS